MEKARLIIYFLILLTLIGATWSAVTEQNWDTLFVVIMTLVLSLIPYILNRRYEVEIGDNMRLGMVVFLFSTLFLGEVQHYYDTYEWWDLLLHFWAGFGLTIFGFAVLTDIYRQSELKSVPFLTTLFAFSFSAMFLGLWEIYEYLIDSLRLSTDLMQPSLSDTMEDLVAGYASTFIVGVFGYRYLKWRKRNFAGKAIESTHVAEGTKKTSKN